METHTMYYDTIIRLTAAISQCKDPEEVALITAESVKTAFKAKGCSVFIVDRGTRELGLVASFGLSAEYLNKGPIHFMQTIQEAKDAIPIAIFDVMDDPRIEYPQAAQKEGIASLLGVPIISHNKIIGALRVYTASPWEFTSSDITLAQAVALMCGLAMEMCRMHKGYKTSIEILKNMRGANTYSSSKWTPHEGVPQSVDQSICDYQPKGSVFRKALKICVDFPVGYAPPAVPEKGARPIKLSPRPVLYSCRDLQATVFDGQFRSFFSSLSGGHAPAGRRPGAFCL